MECLAYKGLGMSQYSFIQTTGRYNVRKSLIYSMFSFRLLLFLSQKKCAPKKFSPHKFGPHKFGPQEIWSPFKYSRRLQQMT